MFSPRRFMRGTKFYILILFFVLLALLIANCRRVTHLDEYLPSNLVPSYFQPRLDSYIVDIAVGDCNILFKNSIKCGVPKASEGAYGDVGMNGGWIRVDKDLLLGMHWTTKRFISVKSISSDYYEAHMDEVILDLTVGDPDEDCAIRGNIKCIPKSILTEISINHVFNEEDLANLKDLNKDKKPKLQGEDANPTGADSDQKIQNSADGSNEKTPTDDDFESPYKEKVKVRDEYTTKTGVPLNVEGDSGATSNHPASKKKIQTDKAVTKERESALDKRYIEKSHHNLKDYMRIPSDKEIANSGWRKRSHNLWVKLGQACDNAVTGVDILFGEDAVDPRPHWSLVKTPLKKLGYSSSREPRLSVRKGDKLDYKAPPFQPKVEFGADGKFKVLQVADLHFSTGVGVCRDPVPEESMEGCQADPRTLKFISRVLDIEKPDFVVLTGDQVFGDEAPDPETALFKAVHPFIKRRIPFAITLGNHDDESIVSREQMMQLASSLPYSVSALGPESVDGFGNYHVTVSNTGSKKIGAVLYLLDSHSRSKQPKTNPGYDWFKESQVDWLKMQASAKKDIAIDNSFLSMAFFHIPLPEYRNLEQPRVGQHKEGITAPKYHTGMREALGVAGVQVVSCGHDHANDYCLLNEQSKESDSKSLMWLCYGGGAGEGGYGGYGGYIRRVRFFELDVNVKEIKTWKRAENNPDELFDEQTLVENGDVVTSI